MTLISIRAKSVEELSQLGYTVIKSEMDQDDQQATTTTATNNEEVNEDEAFDSDIFDLR